MSFETAFLGLVIGAFLLLGVTLFVVSIWSRGGRPAPKAVTVTPAKRPDGAAPVDRAA